MKTKLTALILALFWVMLFAVSCNTGGGGDEKPPADLPDSYIYTTGGTLYVVHDGADVTTRYIKDVTSAISDASGTMPLVRNAVPDGAEHMLLLGDTGHPLSETAMSLLADAGHDDGYALYSDGASLALVWSCEYAAECGVEYMIKNLCTGATLTLKNNYFSISPVDTAAHEAEILEAGFTAMKGQISDEAIEAVRTLYTLYTDDFYLWLASLYDPEIGAFYYSNSARDNEPFLPDIESTGQALSILDTSGMFDESGSWSKALPAEVLEAIGSFTYNMQAEDGYFYHVQWGTNINISRRGRDLNRSATILSALGIKPKYKLATEQLADDALEAGHLVTSLGGSSAVAVSRIVATADVDYLSSEEKFLAYLDSLDFKNASYASGHQLSSTSRQIKAAGLSDVCIKYLDERQNPENGFWEDTVTYTSMNGFLKISSTYNGLGGTIKYLDRAIDSIFEILFSEEMPTTLPQLYNLTNGINNSLNNLKNQGDTELFDATRKRVRDNAERIAKELYRKISTFRKDDGSFSYYVDYCSPTSQGVPVALKLNEGDVNACSMAFHATSGFFKILGLDMPRIFTQYDAEVFCDLLANAAPVTKIELPAPEHTTYEDGTLPNNTVPALKAGALNFIEDTRPGGDYVMELVSYPGNSDSVRVNLMGSSSRVPSCFVYEFDLCIARNAADGTVVQLNTTNYMLNLRVTDGEIAILDCSLTSGTDRFTNDTGMRAKVGEWFTLRIEYYLGDADSVRIVTTLNGKDKFVSNNYYGGQPSLVDQPNEPIPGITNKGIMFFCMKASDISLLIDNVLVDSTADVYVPDENEDKFNKDEGETGPLYTFDPTDALPGAVVPNLQGGSIEIAADPRTGAVGNVVKSVSAEGMFENFGVLGETSSNGYTVSAEICYTDFNVDGVVARVAFDTAFSLDFRRTGEDMTVRITGTTDVIHSFKAGEWFTLGATVTKEADGSYTVSVYIDGTEILTATAEAPKSALLTFTTLKASTHTTYVDDVLIDGVK